MKKYIVILAALIFAVSACQKNTIELLDQPIIKTGTDGSVSYTFTAVIADDLSDADTKASVSRTGAFSWASGDALKFYKSDGTAYNASVTAYDGSTATITVTGTDTNSDFVSAIYPASAADGKNKINFNTRGPIVVSAVTGGTLVFHHIGSLINLKFTSIPTGTASLVFTPSSDFAYDGTFSFSGRVPSLTSTGTTSKIVVSASTSDEGEDITVCVPSVSLSGFTVDLNNAAAGNGRNLFKKSTTTTRDLATNAPVLLNMKKVACVEPSMFYVTTSSSSHYWDVSSAPIVYNGTDYSSYMNFDGGTDVYLIDDYNPSGYKFAENQTAGFYSVTASATTSSVYRHGETLNSPWGWGTSYFENNKMYVMGPLVGDDFSSGSAMTYKNHTWILDGININSNSTKYEFKFKTGDNWWGLTAELSSSVNHAKAYKKDNSNIKKTFSETGIYSLYLNATDPYISGAADEACIQFMFLRTGDLPAAN